MQFTYRWKLRFHIGEIQTVIGDGVLMERAVDFIATIEIW